MEASAWLAQIGLFVLLGLLASPQRLPQTLLPALVVGGALLFVARPASILLCATPFRMPWKEQAFMSWAGLRGAVPIVLATIPMTLGYPGAERIFDVVFLLVVIFTLIQGPPLPFLARRLQLVETGATRELDIESAPLDELDATLLHVDVPRRSRLVGVAISELRLPGDAMITLIVRRQRLFVPDSRTVLRPGDRLMVVTTNDDRVNVERRMRAVSRAGRLARWRGGGRSGDRNASTPGPATTNRTTDGPVMTAAVACIVFVATYVLIATEQIPMSGCPLGDDGAGWRPGADGVSRAFGSDRAVLETLESERQRRRLQA